MSEDQTQVPMPPADSRTASQKIQDLERAVGASFQTMDNMTRDILTIKEAIKLLGNKVDAIVKALQTSMSATINDDVISKIMVENNVEELKNKVTDLVTQGILAPQDEVDDNSFLVGREVNDIGEVVNPRLQFTLQALVEDLRGKLKGARPGNVVTLQEGKLRFELLETYAVVPVPEQPAAPSEQANA
jgi:hypothetical protein